MVARRADPLRRGSGVVGWNDERVERVKTLWANGLTAEQIASDIGGVTRSAVLGKVHRLKLADRTTSPRTKKPRQALKSADFRRHSHGASAKSVANTIDRALFGADRPNINPRYLESAPSAQLPLPFVPPHERKSILELEDTDCRWPCTERPPHMFCGRPKESGLPYCPSHCRVAFVPAQPRARGPIPATTPALKEKIAEAV